MKVGPSPRRARAAASESALYIASTSLPSTRSPGIPYARAFTQIVREAVCVAVGTEIDQWLFWQTSTTGARNFAAKVIAAWKSGWLVAPSPQKPNAIEPVFFVFIAIAQPTACGICGPMHDDQLT